jgi:hexosaminidase
MEFAFKIIKLRLEPARKYKIYSFMRFTIFCFFFFFIVEVSNAQTTGLTLFPMPKSMNIKAGKLRLSGKVTIAVSGPEKDELLGRSVIRLAYKIQNKSKTLIYPVIVKNREHLDSFSIVLMAEKSATMQIGMEESYSISVKGNQLILQANNTIAAMRGMETILQLLTSDDIGYYFPEVEINDAPRFPWRGLMIDVSRHFIPLEVLKRNIEAMSEVKMNVLHLHLSDNEGFRFESKKFPDLQGKGSNGKYYTQSELLDLVSFASDRGILIVPEFDIPGHSKSWFAGYPQLASSPGPFKPGPGYMADASNPINPANLLKFIKTYPTPAMNPAKESTYEFLDTFFTEVSHVFPSPYIHIGVDENNGVVWMNNNSIVDFMNEKGMHSTDKLQEYFAQRVDEIIKKHGKATIGWEEIYSAAISKKVLLQIWDTRAPKTRSIEILRHGNYEINSRGYYLDLFMPAYVHYLNDPLPYQCPDSLKRLVLGGEAAIWTELANEENIESRIWPRTAAVAERLWSQASQENVDDMYRRLFVINQSIAQHGLQHIEKYERRLSNLAGKEDYEGLKTLVDVLSPVKGYKRVMALFFNPFMQNETSTLDSIADIAWVDPEVRRKFRIEIISYFDKPTASKEKEIRKTLYSWSKNHERIDSLLRANPKLVSLFPLSKDLTEVSRIGIKALDYLHMKSKPPVSWTSEKLSVLKSASKAQAEVELSIVPEIEALVRQKLTPEQKGFPLF